MKLYESLFFGITLGISIGPIALLIFNNGLTHSKAAGFASGLGAALADFTYALAGFCLGSLLSGSIGAYKPELTIVSGIILLLFGLYMLYGAIADSAGTMTPKKSSTSYLRNTYLLTLSNPLTILLFAGFAARMHVNSVFDAIQNALAVFAGSLMIQSIIGLGGAYLGQVIRNPVYLRASRILSAIVISCFGLSSLFQISLK